MQFSNTWPFISYFLLAYYGHHLSPANHPHLNFYFTASQDALIKKDGIPPTLQIRAAIATGLGAAAAHAKLLADQEDREIEHLLATIIGTQVNDFYLSFVPAVCPFGALCAQGVASHLVFSQSVAILAISDA